MTPGRSLRHRPPYMSDLQRLGLDEMIAIDQARYERAHKYTAHTRANHMPKGQYPLRHVVFDIARRQIRREYDPNQPGHDAQ